jgi:hypothetical protein
MSRYKGQLSAKSIERDHPHAVEMLVPPDGFGRRLDAMHEWIRARGAAVQAGRGRFDEGRWFVTWCFADAETTVSFAADFVVASRGV